MGLYFEDFAPGQKYVTPARTVTEADVVNFAGLSGDYNPLHTDAAYAEGTIFKGRIAHGMLGLTIVTGLTARMGIFDGTAVGLLEIDEWKFLKPIYLGDTVRAEMIITEKKETRHADRGLLLRQVNLVNQHDTIVQQGIIKVMMKRKPAASESLQNK